MRPQPFAGADQVSLFAVQLLVRLPQQLKPQGLPVVEVARLQHPGQQHRAKNIAAARIGPNTSIPRGKNNVIYRQRPIRGTSAIDAQKRAVPTGILVLALRPA